MSRTDARDAAVADRSRVAVRGLRARFLRLALINALANLTVPLAGLVDTAMLGHLGQIHHLAGVGLGSILFDYLYWTFGFLRMATTGRTAQAVGRGDREEVMLLLLRSLLLAVAIASALLALQAPLRDLGFWILSGDVAVEDAGRAYYDARIWGALPALANFAFLGWYLGREQVNHVLLMTVVANASNVALDYLFIVRLGLEAYGAGLATMISQYLMLVTALVLFARGRPHVRVSWRRILERAPLFDLLRLNRDILIRTFCLITAFSAFTNLSAVIGTGTLAANLILLRIVNTAAYLIDGVAFATESLAGVFKGAGDVAALRRLLRLAMLWGEGLAFGVLLALQLFPDPIYALLTSHADVIAAIRTVDAWLIVALPLGAAAYIFDGFFLGLATGRILRNAMLLALFAGFAPLAGAAYALDSNPLLWLALTLFFAFRAATLGWARRAVMPAA
ncbi:MAG: MATE family efflux transporter [Deltaproteobacteria bacterium]|nr:MAG: MATE family efflux transporter [Deltaproteobacteria bacterium]